MPTAKRRHHAPLARAKNAIRGAIANKASLEPIVSREMATVPFADIAPLIEWTKRHTGSQIKFALDSKPVDYPSLASRNGLSLGSLSRQLHWLGQLLSPHKQALQRFADLAEQFELAWLSDDLAAAAAHLQTLENELGTSLWLIDARIALLRATDGLEKQKSFAQSVHAASPNTVAAFIAHYVSVRNEENVSAARFTARASVDVSDQNVSQGMKRFLLYFLTNEVEPSPAAHLDVLIVASATNPIDAFDTLVCLSQAASTTPELAKYWPDYAAALAPSGDDIWFVAALLELFGARPIARPILPGHAAEDLLNGYYQQAVTSAIASLRGDPSQIQQIETLAMAAAIGRIEPDVELLPKFSAYLVPRFIALFRRQGSIVTAYNDLKKLFVNSRFLRRLRGQEGLAAREWLEGAEVGVSSGTLTFVASQFLAPTMAVTLPQPIASQFVDRLPPAQFPLGRAVASAQIRGGALLNAEIPEPQRREANVLSALYVGDFKRARLVAQSLDEKADAFWHRRASRLVIAGLIDSGLLGDAVEQVASYCTEEADLRFAVPLHSLLHGRQWRDLSYLQSTIALPIVLDIYLGTFDDPEQETNRRAAYDGLMRATGLLRPSELPPDRFPRAQLTYFWEHLCVADVMDVSFQSFSSSRELDEERLKVLQQLTKLNPSATAAYNDEIRDLTKLLRIQDALKDVDRSRIHVDFDAIQRRCAAELAEQFLRYQSLTAAGIGPTSAGLREAFDTALRNADNGDPAALHPYVTYPDDEASTSLRQIIAYVENEYLNDRSYGLDAYLSMRVRHGSLSGHLRGPLQRAHLISARDPGSSRHARVEYWDRTLPALSVPQQQLVQDAVGRFSDRFERVVDDLIKTRLQIRSPEKPDGMFYFADHSPVLWFYMRARITSHTTISDFINELYYLIEARIQSELGEIKTLIEGNIKTDMGHAIDQLREELRDLFPEDARYRLEAAIAQASVDLGVAVDRVAGWFAPVRETLSLHALTLDQIVDVAIAATHAAYTSFSPEISRHISELDIEPGGVLSEFTDILFVVLGNIHQHSGISPSPRVEVSITGRDYDDSRIEVIIRVENDVAAGVHSDAVESKLRRIRTSFQTEEFKQRVNREGGSGFLKLQRLALSDPRRQLSFGFTDADRFFVEINAILPRSLKREAAAGA